MLLVAVSTWSLNLLIIVCGVLVGVLSSTAGARQSVWMKAIEKRVGKFGPLCWF